jgi:hypothetical protein
MSCSRRPGSVIVMTRLSPSFQRNAVSEGFALGLLMRGCVDLPFDKLALDFAFRHAFDDWSYRHQFPRVVTDMDLERGTAPVLVMFHADEKKRTWLLYWEREGARRAVRTRGDWEAHPPNRDEAAARIAGDVPAEGWEELAKAFLAELGEDTLKA